MGDRHGPKYVLRHERTLAEMKAAGAHVILSSCGCPQRGPPSGPVDLDKLIEQFGAAGCLWDRRVYCAKCKRHQHYLVSAGPGTPPRPMLSGGRRVLGLPPSAISERRKFLATFGFSKRDVVRIRALAESLTEQTSPAALADLDVPVRVGACWPGMEERYSGEILGGWQGRTLLYWRMSEPEQDVWRRRPKGPRLV